MQEAALHGIAKMMKMLEEVIRSGCPVKMNDPHSHAIHRLQIILRDDCSIFGKMFVITIILPLPEYPSL
jgi:hypothetical protein